MIRAHKTQNGIAGFPEISAMVMPRSQLVLLYVGIISHSLFSFYFYQANVAPFALLSALILCYFFLANYRYVKHIMPNGFLNPILFLIFYCSSILISMVVCWSEGYYLHLPSLIGFILDVGLFFGLLSLACNSNLSVSAHRAFCWFFMVSLVVFLVQAFSWYFLGVELDFMSKWTGEEQRLVGHQMDVNGITTRRAAGLFAEPAIYSWVMVGLAHFLFVAEGVGRRRIRTYVVAAAYFLSILFSFSLSGWALALTSLVTIVIRQRNVRLSLLIILLLAILLFLFYPYLEAYWYGRVTMIDEDGSYNDKLSVFTAISNVFRDPIFWFFGVGLATRLDIPALGFGQSSLLLFGFVGSAVIIGFFMIVVHRLPGRSIDKLFIVAYIFLLGNHVTSTLTWFMFGSMCFLMMAFGDSRNAHAEMARCS